MRPSSGGSRRMAKWLVPALARAAMATATPASGTGAAGGCGGGAAAAASGVRCRLAGRSGDVQRLRGIGRRLGVGVLGIGRRVAGRVGQGEARGVGRRFAARGGDGFLLVGFLAAVRGRRRDGLAVGRRLRRRIGGCGVLRGWPVPCAVCAGGAVCAVDAGSLAAGPPISTLATLPAAATAVTSGVLPFSDGLPVAITVGAGAAAACAAAATTMAAPVWLGWACAWLGACWRVGLRGGRVGRGRRSAGCAVLGRLGRGIRVGLLVLVGLAGFAVLGFCLVTGHDGIRSSRGPAGAVGLGVGVGLGVDVGLGVGAGLGIGFRAAAGGFRAVLAGRLAGFGVLGGLRRLGIGLSLGRRRGGVLARRLGRRRRGVGRRRCGRIVDQARKRRIAVIRLALTGRIGAGRGQGTADGRRF